MHDHPLTLYRQAFVVLDSRSAAPAPPTLDSTPGPSVNYPPMELSQPAVTGPAGAWNLTESIVLGTMFSNVPYIWRTDLAEGYQELGLALKEMTELDEGDEWKVDAPVYNAACFVAEKLMAGSCPAPRVFNHGPKSVVFNWTFGDNNLYFTVSADRMSALISSPERIQRRIDYSASQLIDPSIAYFYISASYSGTASKPRELSA